MADTPNRTIRDSQIAFIAAMLPRQSDDVLNDMCNKILGPPVNPVADENDDARTTGYWRRVAHEDVDELTTLAALRELNHWLYVKRANEECAAAQRAAKRKAAKRKPVRQQATVIPLRPNQDRPNVA